MQKYLEDSEEDEPVRQSKKRQSTAKGKGRAKAEDTDDAMPSPSSTTRKNGSRRPSRLSESSNSAEPEDEADGQDDESEEVEEDSDPDESFYTNKKEAARKAAKARRKALSSQSTAKSKKKKKLLQKSNREDSEDFDSDLYAAYGSRNAPRAQREQVNYNENEAYDSMLSDTITDEEPGSDEKYGMKGSGRADEGDAVDGVFDYKRADGHGARESEQ